MSYDAWKCASPEEGLELEERWDDVTSVEECAHGEHPLECSLCTSAGLHAAVSGIRTLGPNPGEWSECGECGAMFPSESYCNNCAAVGCEGDTMDENTTDDSIDQWIARASVVKLKRAYFAIENEVARRKADVAAEAKALEAFEKPVRKTRSDAGTTRRKVEAA